MVISQSCRIANNFDHLKISGDNVVPEKNIDQKFEIGIV